MTGSDGMPPAPWGASGEGGGEGTPAVPPPVVPAAVPAGAPAVAKKRKTGRNVAIVGGVAALLLVVGAAASPLGAGSKVELVASQTGMLNAEAAKNLVFTINGATMSDVTLKLDGKEVQGTQEGDNIVYRAPSDLADGKHTFSASKDGRLPGRTATSSETFEIDTVAPVVTFEIPDEPANMDEAYTLKGKVEGAKTAEINGEPLDLADDGTFAKEFAAPPRGAILKATDEAGNVTEQAAEISVFNPAVRSVHVTAFGWASSTLREPILQLLKDKKIDNVQLDIKDEDGIIGYESEVPLAKAAGTGTDRYVAADALKQIHDLGGTVTGRIVAFRDPKLAGWAVSNGKMDLVIQNTSGGAYDAGKYGRASFTNFANAEIKEYNIGLAVEAAKLGFDQIMFDYIRKPENSGQVYPGIGDRDASQAIVDFVAEASPRVRAAGAFVGAAVYGISAFTPVSVAQDIPEMAKHLDFLAPMVYPSHWGPGEYSVAKPNSQPYDIVHRSMMEFNRLVLGTDCAIVPWLQDFSLGVSYGVAEVKAQIKAAADAGINGFYLWNASSKYTAAALEAMQPGDAQPGELIYSMVRPGVNPGEGTTDAQAAEEYIKAYLEAKKNGTTFVPPGSETTTEPDTTEGTESESTESESTESTTESEGTESEGTESEGTESESTESTDGATASPSPSAAS